MPLPSSDQIPFGRKSLRDEAAEQIRSAIFDGTLQPGENLNDQELQDWLGVSRTPIREALNDLARVGLIEMAPQRYTRVAVPSPESRLHVLQTLGALVGGVVRVTVPYLTDEQRTTLLSLVDAALTAVRERDSNDQGRRTWILVAEVIHVCPNPILVAATRDTIDAKAYQLSVTDTEAGTMWDALEEGFTRFRRAIEEGDAIEAELGIETVFQL